MLRTKHQAAREWFLLQPKYVILEGVGLDEFPVSQVCFHFFFPPGTSQHLQSGKTILSKISTHALSPLPVSVWLISALCRVAFLHVCCLGVEHVGSEQAIQVSQFGCVL